MTSGAVGAAIPAALVVVALLASHCAEAYIGMNWGRQSAQRLVPSQVVDLMLQNGIRNARIYTAQEDIMMAFQNSGINLTITLAQSHLPSNISYARHWVRWKYNFLKFSDIPSMIVGDNGYVFDLPDYDVWWRGLNYIQTALDESGLRSRIKANFVHHAGLLIPNITKPSEAEFRADIRDRMVEFLQFLRNNDAPFMVEFFPVGDVQRFGLDITFAFPDNTSKLVINDVKGAVYRNGFDWMYDCFVWALEKVNASDIRILVAQVGWPTDGFPWSNVVNSERFYKHLLPMVSSNKGTPKRPGAPIDIYVNSLTDEPMMKAFKPSARHRGIYRSNGEPKFKIDLTGRGLDIYPSKVRGIMRMPERWCVFNGDTRDMMKVQRQMDFACSVGDCTTLAPSASCSNLGFHKNVSYAFNVYFQTLFQDEEACDFEGLGLINDEDPSTAECVFPVEVVRGEQVIELRGAAATAVAAATHRRQIKGNGVLLCVLYIMGLIVVSFIFLMFFEKGGRTSSREDAYGPQSIQSIRR